MSQVSYGTITITDTTDLTTYIRYAKKSPLTEVADFQITPTEETRYIAVLSIPSSDTIPAWNSTDWKWSEFIGTDGVSVLGTREIYYLKTNNNTVVAPANGSDIDVTSENVENTWTKSVPTYVTNGEYWTCIQTHLDGSPTWVYGSPVLNQSLTDMNHDIDVMKSITQQTAEDAQGAMSQAAATQVAQEALASKLRHMWENQKAHYQGVSGWTKPDYPVGTYMASGIDGVTFDTEDSSTYGFNSLLRHTYLSFRYNAHQLVTIGTGIQTDDGGISGLAINTPIIDANNVVTNVARGMELTSSSLKFYHSPTVSGNTVTPGAKAMELTGNELNFYGSSTSTADATLNSTGLKLTKGGIVVVPTDSSIGSNNSIYISSDNLGSKVASLVNDDTKTNWRAVIGSKFGVDSEGNLYANNATISGTMTIGANSTINGTNASTVVNNASTGAGAAADLATYKTTVSNTYATQEALSDVEEQIPDVSGLASKSAAIAEEQLIYIQATSGTNSVSAYPSSSTTTSSYWVTQTGESIPNGTPPDGVIGQTPRWTIKRPSYQKNYPVIFVAKQKKTVSGEITCSTPIKDDTITIIDGGHITTGTIDASRLSVYDATINKISASAIDVSSIQIGQSQVNNLTTDLGNKASVSAEYSVDIVTSNFDPTATGTDTFITLTAKVSRVDGTAVGTISYAWYGDNSNTAISGATSASYNVPANLVWNGTSGYKTFTVQVN